jgi:hypothetical protein
MIGLFIDKKGKRIKALILSGFIGIITYIMFITLDPIFPLITLGFAFSIFAAVIWPSFSMIIPKDFIVRFFHFIK